MGRKLEICKSCSACRLVTRQPSFPDCSGLAVQAGENRPTPLSCTHALAADDQGALPTLRGEALHCISAMYFLTPQVLETREANAVGQPRLQGTLVDRYAHFSHVL